MPTWPYTPNYSIECTGTFIYTIYAAWILNPNALQLTYTRISQWPLSGTPDCPLIVLCHSPDLPRHEFYETDEKLILSVFDRGADPEQVSITFEPRKVRCCHSYSFESLIPFRGQFTYAHGEKSLVLEPLKGQIDPDASDYTVGKVKVEVRLIKRAQGRWGDLVGDSPDRMFPFPSFFSGGTAYIPDSTALTAPTIAPTVPPPVPSTSTGVRKPQKNWDALTTTILSSEKEKTTEEDPNVGGDSTLNSFFQKIFGDADDDTKRAMMKSYQESGGTTLSTNWDEVKKAKVEVKPPAGAEWKKWN